MTHRVGTGLIRAAPGERSIDDDRQADQKNMLATALADQANLPG